MKAITVCFLALAALACARPEDKYTDKYDNINVEEILNNRRLLTPYIKCILDQGKCSPEGKELKSHIKEALETFCEKCTPVQRDRTRQVIHHLIKNEHEYWTQMTAKYDPTRQFTQKYEAELAQVSA